MATDIFISHAAIDEELARALKGHLQMCFPDLAIFVSSDPEDLQPGDLWIEKILTALETAKCILALTTTRGLERKWVWFESGRAWFNKIPLIPCCVGNLRKSGLPAPFSSLQALNIDEADGVTALENRLTTLFGVAVGNHEATAVAANLTRLDIRAEEKQKITKDPFAREIIEDLTRIMNTLSKAEQETIRHFTMFGQLSTTAARAKAQLAGVDMEKWSVPWSLAQRTGWLTKVSGGESGDMYGDSIYVMNEQTRAYLRAFFAQ